MSYVHDWSDPLDVIQAPFRALSAPWGALQTGVATGDWGQAGESLIDPDKAVRGRQFLEKLGVVNPSSGAVGDVAGAAVDLADPVSWLALGGLGKAYQAVRGVGEAATAAPAAKGIGGWLPTAFGVSDEELNWTFPKDSVPANGVLTKDQVRSLVQKNGISIEKQTYGGASQEGAIAKAAREKYLAAEAEHQKAMELVKKPPPGTRMTFKQATGQEPHPLHQAAMDAGAAKEAAYDDMNATAGKSDRLIQAERDRESAYDAYRASIENSELPRGYKLHTSSFGEYVVKDNQGRTISRSFNKAEVMNDVFSKTGGGPPSVHEARYALDAASQRFRDIKRVEEVNAPRYSIYATPGGQNYMERLITMPQRHQQEQMDRLLGIVRGDIPHDPSNAEESALVGGYTTPNEIMRKRDKEYTSPHWPDNPNVLAHWRADDRTGPNGEKVLHIQEVQSDWHQAGRDRGYRTNDKSLEDANDRVNMALGQQSSVPDAPFKNNEWANLALKDIMDHALKNGYDAISFNNGALAKRYAAGGGGDLKGLVDWYERQLPQRMQKLFGLKNESHEVPFFKPGSAEKQTVPFFRLSPEMKEQIAAKGAPLMERGTNEAEPVGLMRSLGGHEWVPGKLSDLKPAIQKDLSPYVEGVHDQVIRALTGQPYQNMRVGETPVLHSHLSPVDVLGHYYEHTPGGAQGSVQAAMKYNRETAGGHPNNPGTDPAYINQKIPVTQAEFNSNNAGGYYWGQPGNHHVSINTLTGKPEMQASLEHEFGHATQTTQNMQNHVAWPYDEKFVDTLAKEYPSAFGKNREKAEAYANYFLSAHEIDANITGPVRRLYSQITGKYVETPADAAKAINLVETMQPTTHTVARVQERLGLLKQHGEWGHIADYITKRMPGVPLSILAAMGLGAAAIGGLNEQE